jgi:catechol 2,3-dioxygenase-like lactoylglutathione lyase family enzyme
MPVIRYIAYLSDDPAAQADFYHRYLGTEEIGRSPHGDIAITDGFYNLSFIKRRPELMETRPEVGLNHIGLSVDDLDETLRRYREIRPRGPIVEEPSDVAHGQVRIYDPDANPVSLSEGGFGVADARTVPGIRHVAYNALEPDTMLEFYRHVLGLRELGTSLRYREIGRPNRFAGDGCTNLAVHPFHVEQEGHEPRFGINHIGFLVANLRGMVDDLSAARLVTPRPASRPFAEVRFRDPEGNGIDLSQDKGWEVDVDAWDRGESR